VRRREQCEGRGQGQRLVGTDGVHCGEAGHEYGIALFESVESSTTSTHLPASRWGDCGISELAAFRC
jgi:hypothetical protein